MGQVMTDHQAEEGPGPWEPKATFHRGHHSGRREDQPGARAQPSARASGTAVDRALPASPREVEGAVKVHPPERSQDPRERFLEPRTQPNSHQSSGTSAP